MDLAQKASFYGPALPTSKNSVPLNPRQPDGGRTDNEYLAQIEFCQVCILRTAFVAELKLYMSIVLTQAYASRDFQVVRIDSSPCMAPVIWHREHFFWTPTGIDWNEAEVCNFQQSENW
jgi:hypothetical protein